MNTHEPRNPVRTLARQRIGSRSIPLDTSLADLNLARIRESFALLFDQAAAIVQQAGRDHDNGVIERSVTCAVNKVEAMSVPVDALGDPRRFRESVIGRLESALNRSVDPVEVRLLEARVDVVIEEWTS